MKSIVKITSYGFRFCTSLTHIESDYRSLHPFLLHFHYLQSLEQFLLSREVGFECIDKHRLAKATWAAQVIIRFICVGKLPDNICLVNIKVSFFSDFLKRLDAYWQSSIVCLYHNPRFVSFLLQMYNVFPNVHTYLLIIVSHASALFSYCNLFPLLTLL